MTKLTAPQLDTLKSLQYGPRMLDRDNWTVGGLLAAGLAFRSWYEVEASEYMITPAGLAVLYQDAPLADQPAPFVPYQDWGQIEIDGEGYVLMITAVNGNRVTLLDGYNGLNIRRPASEVIRAPLVDQPAPPANLAVFKGHVFTRAERWVVEFAKEVHFIWPDDIQRGLVGRRAVNCLVALGFLERDEEGFWEMSNAAYEAMVGCGELDWAW